MGSTGQIGQSKRLPVEGSPPNAPASPGRRLDSWKAIAQYLDRDIRSVQRWERDRGLPIHRLPGQKGGAVFAYERELDEWLGSGGQGTDPHSTLALEALLPTPTTADEPAAVPAAAVPRRLPRKWLFVAALLIAAGGLLLLWRLRWSSASRPIRSIAVLPLQNLSSDPDQEYFADGMTDELITDLAQAGELKVVSKTSVLQYEGTRKPLPQIARELGVDAVVEGSVLREGDRVRITAQLISASTDRHIWARSYEGDLRNVLSLQARSGKPIALLSSQLKTYFIGNGLSNAIGLPLLAATIRRLTTFICGVGMFRRAGMKRPCKKRFAITIKPLPRIPPFPWLMPAWPIATRC